MNMQAARTLLTIATEFGGREMDMNTTIDQIGMMNVLAISGGRRARIANSLDLPVSSGYHVIVTLEANDTYTVRRVYVRGPKAWIKAEVRNVYAEQVGEIAYRASCFRDDDSLPLAV